MSMSRLFKKTLLVMVALFGVVSVCISAYSAWVLRQELMAEYRSKALAIATSVAATNLDIFPTLDAATIQSLIDQYVSIAGVSYLAVVDGQGQLVAHTFVPAPPPYITNHPPATPGQVGQASFQEIGDDLDTTLPLLGGAAGWVHVGMDLGHMRGALWRLIAQQQALTLGLFTFGVILAYFLMNGISRPLEHLAEYARRLKDRDFSAAPPATSGDDELGVLTQAMTAMSGQLQTHMENLQKEVDTATNHLRHTLGYLSTILENLAEGLLVMDQDGRILQTNPAMCRMLGLGDYELISRSCNQVFGRSLAQLEALTLRHAEFSEENTLAGILTITRADGVNFPVEASLSWAVSDGQRHAVCMVRDITRQRRYQEALQRAQETLERRVFLRTSELLEANRRLEQEILERRIAQEALESSEERFRSLSENAPDIILALDYGGHVTYVNPTWRRILGHQPREVLGKGLEEFSRRSEAAEYKDSFTRLLRDGSLITDQHLTLTSADQKPRMFSLSGAPNRDQEGQVLGMVGVLKDITEQRRLEGQLIQAQKMEALGTLAGGVAHEFNNILMSIMGYTQLMSLPGANPVDFQTYAQKIDAGCQRAAQLTKKMLTFSRLEVGDQEPVRVNQALRGVTDLLSQTLPPSVRLELELTPNLPPALASPVQLEQVVLNLALNARDAMAGGGDIHLSSGMAHLTEPLKAMPVPVDPGDYLVITVRDHGTGMSPLIMERIFDPFFTTKEPGQGTGLGLSVAYSIVQNHHGFLTVESQPGQGSEFRIYLPATDQAPSAQAPSQPASAALPQGNGQRVLVTDDEEHIRDILAQALGDVGYQVEVAANGQEAVEVFRRAMAADKPLDLVIMDLAMPVMDGSQALEAILEVDPQARVLLATGHGGAPHQADLLARRVWGILQKPFNLSTLLASVNQALNAPRED